MIASIQKWGNSLAIRIPKPLAENLGVSEGSEVTITSEEGRLLISPAAPHYNLADLLKGITRKNLHAETDTGAAQGGEAW
jgi:antitoxin MazE